MGQCAVVDRLPCSGHSRNAAEDLLPSRADSSSASFAAEALPDALRRFRARGREVVRAAEGAAGEARWGAACDLVEALLLGVRQHLDGAIQSVELGPRPAAPSAREGEPAAEQDVAVSISVRFGRAPLVGEFATRSRQPCEIHLDECVTFALQRPSPASTSRPATSFWSKPLVLKVSGFALAALPDIGELRARLEDALGERMDEKTAGAWWAEHRDRNYPLHASKLRRVCESIPGASFIPRPLLDKAQWGYLSAVSRSFDAFEFHSTPDGKINVSCQTHLTHSSEAPYSDRAAEMCREMLRMHRLAMTKFAPTTVAIGSMLEGRNLGQLGAAPEKIVKAFTAAKHWGPGEDGWHRLDDTWQCVDKKDRFGRVLEEQGRIVWHWGDEEAKKKSARMPSKIEQQPVLQKPRKSGSGCTSTVMMLTSAVVMMYALVPAMALGAATPM